jgi:hypothetical protein
MAYRKLLSSQLCGSVKPSVWVNAMSFGESSISNMLFTCLQMGRPQTQARKLMYMRRVFAQICTLADPDR